MNMNPGEHDSSLRMRCIEWALALKPMYSDPQSLTYAAHVLEQFIRTGDLGLQASPITLGRRPLEAA